MRHQSTDRFLADHKRLSERERVLFADAVRAINRAYAERGDRALPRWPARLRIRAMRGAAGILEMTWSFSGPDGRATFEIVDVDGEPGIRWRRIGSHDI